MSQSRFMQIDALRGLLLIMMTVDHLLIWPFDFWSAIYEHSYGPFGFFSAAEAFYFISGLLAGMLLANKPQVILGNLQARLGKLYLANLACIAMMALSGFLAPAFFAQWGNVSWIQDIYYHPFQIVLLASLFLYLPSFFDILPVYCCFFLLLPLILRLIRADKMGLLLFFSLSLYGLGQLALLQKISLVLGHVLPRVSLGWFDIFSWQLLFVSAVVAGYYFGRKKLDQLIERPLKPLVGALIGFCGICFLARHGWIFQDIFWEKWIEVRTLGPLRLLNFLAAAYLTTLLLNKVRIFNIPALAMLGRRSLRTFLYHCCLVYILGAFMNELKALSTGFQIAVFTLAVLSLWLAPLFSGSQLRISPAWRPILKIKEP